MEKKFVFLTSVSDLECEILCERLRSYKIPYELRDENFNAPERRYGTHSSLVGKNIFIPEEKLKLAKDLLGIKKSNPLMKIRKFPSWMRLLALVWLVVFLILLIWQIYSVFKNF
jgi:hypothetical protein